MDVRGLVFTWKRDNLLKNLRPLSVDVEAISEIGISDSRKIQSIFGDYAHLKVVWEWAAGSLWRFRKSWL